MQNLSILSCRLPSKSINQYFESENTLFVKIGYSETDTYFLGQRNLEKTKLVPRVGKQDIK